VFSFFLLFSGLGSRLEFLFGGIGCPALVCVWVTMYVQQRGGVFGQQHCLDALVGALGVWGNCVPVLNALEQLCFLGGGQLCLGEQQCLCA
jgi:hypothetical protein